MSSVYVLAMVGESPAVVSELLWWLRAREGAAIAGIEVWATASGADQLRAMAMGQDWADLEAQVGALPPLLADETEPSASFGFRIHRLRGPGGELDDVRTAQESAVVNAELHDRLRQLRRDLADHIAIVGSLAGGRKTVSAALQNAFCMQAGNTDRLVHVLLNASLEQRLRQGGQLSDYAFPTPGWAEAAAVAMEEQVVVYDVRFPRLRSLVPEQLQEVLEHRAWEEVWPELDKNAGRTAKATLRRLGIQSWHYAVWQDQQSTPVWQTELGQRAGAILAAMVFVEPDAGQAEVLAWLDANEVGWRPSNDRSDDDTTRTNKVRSAASDLRKRLKCLPVGLESFRPKPQTYTLSGEVDASITFGEAKEMTET